MSRLKVVLAHDRTGLDEITMAKIRVEIQAVVAKYVRLEALEPEVLCEAPNTCETTVTTLEHHSTDVMKDGTTTNTRHEDRSVARTPGDCADLCPHLASG